VLSAAGQETESGAIAWLVAEVPELRVLLDEHLEDNHGELLPYLVFEGAFVRWFADQVRRGDRELARRFVDAVEPLMATEAERPADDRGRS